MNKLPMLCHHSGLVISALILNKIKVKDYRQVF